MREEQSHPCFVGGGAWSENDAMVREFVCEQGRVAHFLQSE